MRFSISGNLLRRVLSLVEIRGCDWSFEAAKNFASGVQRDAGPRHAGKAFSEDGDWSQWLVAAEQGKLLPNDSPVAVLSYKDVLTGAREVGLLRALVQVHDLIRGHP